MIGNSWKYFAAGGALLAVSIGLLFFSACGSAIPQTREDVDLKIAVTTDIHYLSPSITDSGPAFLRFTSGSGGKDLLHIDAIVDAFTRDLAAAPPDILVVTGDLTSNGEKESHRSLAAKFKKIEDLGIQVLVIPGNHDILNPWSRGFSGDKQVMAESVSPGEFRSIYRNFGFAEARSRDRASLSYVTAVSPGLWIMMLDSSLYRDNRMKGKPASNGLLSKETLLWIRDMMDEAKRNGARIVAAMHHSLIDHNPALTHGFTLDNADLVADTFDELGIHLTLSGHIHIQDAVSIETRNGTLYDIATNALSVYPNQYGMIAYDESEGVLDYFTREVDVEGWAQATRQTDPLVLRFEAESEAAFRASIRELFRNSLDADGKIIGSEEGLTIDKLATLNLLYYSGRENADAAGIADPEGYRLFLKSTSDFLPVYVQSILSETGLNDNSVRIRY